MELPAIVGVCEQLVPDIEPQLAAPAADGTAIPTVAGSLNTAGLGLTVGTRVRSTTLTDFTDTTLDIHDVLAVNLFAVATATCVQVFIQCDI